MGRIYGRIASYQMSQLLSPSAQKALETALSVDVDFEADICEQEETELNFGTTDHFLEPQVRVNGMPLDQIAELGEDNDRLSFLEPQFISVSQNKTEVTTEVDTLDKAMERQQIGLLLKEKENLWHRDGKKREPDRTNRRLIHRREIRRNKILH